MREDEKDDNNEREKRKSKGKEEEEEEEYGVRCVESQVCKEFSSARMAFDSFLGAFSGL